MTLPQPSFPQTWLVFALAAGLATAPAITGAQVRGKNKQQTELTAEDLMVVDCLLPAKVRRLGTRGNYLVPRQPIRTTAVRCRIRGGEHTQPDQANYKTSLKVWLPLAKSGDDTAQFYVGQIFEKGLGVVPDYEGAATWYRRAADQGYTPAQVNLGYLYEMGLGVEQDDVTALNWYRKAAGLAEDLVVLGESAYEELLTSRAEAEARAEEVEELTAQSNALRDQLDQMRASAEREQQDRTATFEILLARLDTELSSKRSELEQTESRVAALESQLESQVASEEAPIVDDKEMFSTDKLDFGRYYALVVGNSNYAELPDLEGAISDARRMARVLEEQYGFEVRLLLDATRVDILRALNDLRETVTEKDNLLVFYAGRGVRDDARDIAYWQPVDSDPQNPVNWIPSGVLVDHLDIMPAKHVFVVADSVFSGLRTRSAVAQLRSGASAEKRFFQMRNLLTRRSRLVLAAGGERETPATEEAGTRFTSALVDVLSDNSTVLEASELHRRMRERLGASPSRAPQFATLRWARNDVADFFFVPAG